MRHHIKEPLSLSTRSVPTHPATESDTKGVTSQPRLARPPPSRGFGPSARGPPSQLRVGEVTWPPPHGLRKSRSLESLSDLQTRGVPNTDSSGKTSNLFGPTTCHPTISRAFLCRVGEGRGQELILRIHLAKAGCVQPTRRAELLSREKAPGANQSA